MKMHARIFMLSHHRKEGEQRVGCGIIVYIKGRGEARRDVYVFGEKNGTS